jgi:uncharacterized protein
VKIRSGSRIFLDTAGLVAVILSRDVFHSEATQVMAELMDNEITAVTTEYVVVEFANFLTKVDTRDAAVLMINDLLTLTNFEITWSDRALFDSAYELYKKRPDKDWSLTDCASFVVMKERDISLAFTSDKHFEQAGFVKLLDQTAGT